jgi:hypothetical protein
MVSAAAIAQTLPLDAQPSCVASPELFQTWFQDGFAGFNGAAKPADSLAFKPTNNCNFYLWSQQMLLWLLGPGPSEYGGSGRVFDSSIFFDVSQPAPWKRYFAPHVPFPPFATASDKARRMVYLRPAKPGPNGLPAVIDRQGNIIEVLRAQLGPNGYPLVLKAGRLVEAARVSVSADKRAVFHDAAGNLIALPKLNIPANLRGARVGVRFFTEDNTPIIVGPDGDVFDVSPAQAGGSGVLLAQNSSIVYYTIVANDVFTYFASGVNSGKIAAQQFPTTQVELDNIQKYAHDRYGVQKTFPDASALAVEVKLSWVDISAVSDPSTYVRTFAFVPTYDTTNPKQWVPTGERFTTLALVGVHIVGSVNRHPEMIWSTYEHFGNSPVGPYKYIKQGNKTVDVPADSAGKWLFSKSNSTGPFNEVHADYQNPPNIQGLNVSPSDTQLVYPFGVAPNGGQPNQEDLSPALANTEVISINNSVQSHLRKLAPGDVRANYYLVGSTWTNGGYAPTGPYHRDTNEGKGAEIGTSHLANSTMETYHQAGSTGGASNCFSCHFSNPGQLATTDISHIFSDMLPLGSVQMTSPTDAPPSKVVPTLTMRTPSTTRTPKKKN